MRFSFTLSVISLTLGLVCPTTAHLLQRREAAGSDSTTTTSSIPSEILTAATDSLTQTTSLPSASAISTLDSSATAATATATDSASGSTSITNVAKCNNPGGEYAPFCKPTNGSTLDFGTTYTVTWDTTYFDANATVVIEIEYANSSSQHNTSVYSTGELENAVGYATISPKEAWLQSSSSANLTFYFSMISADGTTSSGNSATTMTGPTVSLGSSSTTSSDSSSSTSGSLLDSSESSSSSGKSSSNVGLVTGLTIGFAFLALVLVSGFFVWYRRYMIRNRGYGVGKSRKQRLQERQRHASWHGSGGHGRGQQGRGNVRLGEMQTA